METAVQNNNKGVEYLLNKNFEKAEAEFRQALKLDKKNATALNNLGLLYHHKKEFEKAEEFLNKALLVQAKDTYFLNLANAQVFLKKYTEAEQNYQKCLRLNPENTNAKISLAKFYESVGKAGFAREIWENLVQTSDNISFKTESAKNYMSTGNFEKALSVFHPLAAANNSAEIYHYIGICEFYLKNYGLAEQSFKKSLSIEPDKFEARHYLAVNYLSTGDYNSAIKEFDFLIKFEPENIKVKLDKTSVLMNLGKFEEALDIVETVLHLDPKNTKALQYKKLMEELNSSKKRKVKPK